MFPLNEFRDALNRVAEILDRCGIRFLITGGAAAIGYGEPRTTQDIDLVVEADSMFRFSQGDTRCLR